MPYFLTVTVAAVAELLLACAVLFAVLRFPSFGRLVWAGAMRAALRIEARPALLVALAGLLPIALRLLLLPVDPVASPSVMEEFNNLFEADTYAHGRLTNPVHPLAVLLQSYQIVEWPYRLSSRPPLAGLFLALGQAAFGSPFLGNLLSVGLASAALTWMLLAWVPRRWAALGSGVTIASFCLFGYWTNSYWCPAPTVIGGALLLGLAPRVEQRAEWRHGALFAVGLALLAGTRPFEGAVFAAIVLLWLGLRALRPERRADLPRALLRFALPVAFAGLVVLAGQAAYNFATTGNYRLMPYAIWRAAQCIAPSFLWQSDASGLRFDYPGAKEFAYWELGVVEAVRSGGLSGWALLLGRHTVTFRDLLGPILFAPFLCWAPIPAETFRSERAKRLYLAVCGIGVTALIAAWGWASVLVKLLILVSLALRWRSREDRLPILLLMGGMVATSITSFYMNIYFAAFTAPVLVLTVRGLRNLSLSCRPLGAAVAGFLLLGIAAVPAIQAAAYLVGHPLGGPQMSNFDPVKAPARALVVERLRALAGRHVVFVNQYGRMRSDVEQVWNGADVDAQDIVWLRDLDPAWTAAAQGYYRGRDMWLLTLKEGTEPTLVPYPSSGLPPPAPLSALPMPDRAAAEALGARAR